MPFNSYFITLIGIATIIRLGLIMGGPMDANQKAAKMASWIIGLVCVVCAWIALGQIWGVDTNGFHGKQTKTSTKTILDDDTKNANTYYGKDYENQTEDVDIKVNPN